MVAVLMFLVDDRATILTFLLNFLNGISNLHGKSSTFLLVF